MEAALGAPSRGSRAGLSGFPGAIVTAPGEVTERLKVRDWKSRGRVKPPRGFESHPLR